MLDMGQRKGCDVAQILLSAIEKTANLPLENPTQTFPPSTHNDVIFVLSGNRKTDEGIM